MTSSGVAPKNEETLRELEKEHPSASCPILPIFGADVEAVSITKEVVLRRIRSFPKETSCVHDGFRAQHLIDALGKADVAVAGDLATSVTAIVNLLLAGKCIAAFGEFIASPPFTPFLNPEGEIRPISLGGMEETWLQSCCCRGREGSRQVS